MPDTSPVVSPPADRMKRERFIVSGMVCGSCSARIDKRLNREPGIRQAQANYRDNTLLLEYDPAVVPEDRINAILDDMGYAITGTATRNTTGKLLAAGRAAGLIVVILALYTLASRAGLLDYLNIFPEAEAGMGYGMIFVVGLLTSAHCIAMCGGITLSQSAMGGGGEGRLSAFVPTMIYGAGRVASYTIIGFLAGGLGSVISFSGGAKGVVQIVAGVFMMIMGLNLMGSFPWLRRLLPRLPAVFSRGGGGRRGPLIVGLLNGLMPCGPLQAMQLYALSTGNPLQGGLSMLLFSLGTLPLTMGLGFVAAALGRRFLGKAMRVGAALVFLMGIGMLSNGLRLSGFAAPALTGDGEAVAAELMGGVQTVSTELAPGAYQAIRVHAGVPLRWNLHVAEAALNGCNNRIFIPAFGVEKKLSVGDNFIEFTPTASGVFPYMCWMGMIASRIVVGDAADTGMTPEFDAAALPDMNDEQAGSDIPWL